MPVTFTDGTTAGVSTKEMLPNNGYKQLEVILPATFVWGTDVLSINIGNYGGNLLRGFVCWKETTAGSVVVATSATTSVTAGVLTFTTTGSGTYGGKVILWIE